MNDAKNFMIKAGLFASIGLSMVFAVTSAWAADESNGLGRSSGVAKHFPQPERIRYDGHCLTIDGKEITRMPL